MCTCLCVLLLCVSGGQQGPKEFQAEVAILSRLHHPHIVLLIGSCPERCALVYEVRPGAAGGCVVVVSSCCDGQAGHRAGQDKGAQGEGVLLVAGLVVLVLGLAEALQSAACGPVLMLRARGVGVFFCHRPVASLATLHLTC